MGMDIRHLARLDLNLLITLQVLMEEQSVSRTAEKLFLTQPAISKSLSRLRDIFDDPLFTRTGRGLVPTPFTQSLKQPLESILGDMENLFVSETFDPATYKGEFIIAINEFLDMVLFPILIEELSREAPGMHLVTLTQQENQLAGLEKGELDFVLNLKFSDIPKNFESDLLIEVQPALFARAKHPLMKRKNLAFEELLEYPRVGLNVPDMDKLSVFRNNTTSSTLTPWPSAFETENLITALEVISRTDYLLPGSCLIRHFATKDLLFKEVPIQIGRGVKIEYCLVSHDRASRSPAHQWLRQKIISLAKKIET